MTPETAPSLQSPAVLAAMLRNAYQDGPVPPIAPLVADRSVDAAYAIQELNTAHWLAEGRTLAGRKIGLTSKVVQQQLGVDQPDYGMLFSDMAFPHGGIVPAGVLLQPKIEAEIAFTMGSHAGSAHLSEDDFLAAIDSLHPALEIVDSRIERWAITLFDTVADNASSALYVVGPPCHAVATFDFTGCLMTMREDGRSVSQGTGAACLGSPVVAGHWLAQVMAARGRPLQPGDVVLSGALGPMAPVVPGSTYTAEIDGLGEVTIAFAG